MTAFTNGDKTVRIDFRADAKMCFVAGTWSRQGGIIAATFTPETLRMCLAVMQPLTDAEHARNLERVKKTREAISRTARAEKETKGGILMQCALCGKKPNEIGEYIEAAKENELTPDEFVRQEEGTYNQREDVFYCTLCYVGIGMPLGKAHKVDNEI